MDTYDLILWALLIGSAAGAALFTGLVVRDVLRARRTARVARIEADLDRTQAELRQTILRLSEAMGAEAHEARKALIRESFLAAGAIPNRPDRPRQS